MALSNAKDGRSGITEKTWHAGLTNVSQRISYLRSSAKWADLTIIFPGHEKVIQAHKWMLALCSPVFEAMLFGPLAEKDVLSLPDDPPEAFEWLLDNLYCDEGTFPDMETATGVYMMAHKYQIPFISRICSEYMSQQVNAENLPLLYNLAHFVDDACLLKNCEKILPGNSDEVLKSKHIAKLSMSALKHLLENKNMKPTSSLRVFESVTLWGKMEGKRLEEESQVLQESSEGKERPDAAEKQAEKDFTKKRPHDEGHDGEAKRNKKRPPRSLRESVDCLLPLVDFMSLTVDEFVEHVFPSGIFTAEECMNILQAIKGVPEAVLPTCVSPRIHKSMVLVSQSTNPRSIFRNTHMYGGNSHNLFSIHTSRTIHLLEIEAHVQNITLNGELTIYDNVNQIIGKGRWNNSICKFERFIQLKKGINFRFTTETISAIRVYASAIQINVNVDDNRVTGSATCSLNKLSIKYF